MHCHSSICCWPKERPLLKLALMPWEQDILQPQPQEEGAFCHHRGNSITAMQTHPFLWDNILGFDSLLPEGSHLVMKVVGQGLPSDPALHHSLRQCQSTLLAWCGAQHTCDIFVPLSNALPGCSQQWQQLPSAPSHSRLPDPRTHGHKAQPAQRPRHTWESFSESVCCTAMHCRGSAPLCGPYQAIGNVSARLSSGCVFHPRHLGPAVAVSGYFLTGLETVFAVCSPHYAACLLGKTAFHSVLLHIRFFTVASKGCTTPADSCILISAPGESLSSQVCLWHVPCSHSQIQGWPLHVWQLYPTLARWFRGIRGLTMTLVLCKRPHVAWSSQFTWGFFCKMFFG